MTPRRLCTFCVLLLGVPGVTGCCLCSLEALSPCSCHGNLSCLLIRGPCSPGYFPELCSSSNNFFFLFSTGFKAHKPFISLSCSLAASRGSFSMGRQRVIPSVDYVKKVFQGNRHHVGQALVSFHSGYLLFCQRLWSW